MAAPKRDRKTGVYVRISSDPQEKEYGVQRQETECRELADRLKWDVLEVFKDNDISASAFGRKARPGYAALIEAIEQGRINAVIAWNTDRLFRQLSDLEPYITLCNRHAVENESVRAGKIDLSTAAGKMQARNLTVYASFESDLKSERLQAAYKQKAQRGEWHSGIRCWGYEPDGLTIRESEAVDIRRAAAAVIAGQSLRSIAIDMNQRGSKTVTGRSPWTAQHLRTALTRPRLIGQREYKGEVVAVGIWEPVLDVDTFEAVKTILNDPSRRAGSSPRGRAPVALGSAIYYCGVCDEPRMRLGTTTTRRAYRCANVEAGGRHVSRSADKLDAYVTGALLGVLGQPGVIDALCADAAAGDDAEMAKLRLERDTIPAKLNELDEMFTSGTLNRQRFEKMSRRWTERDAEISSILSALAGTSPVDVLRGVDNIETCWDAVLTIGQKRQILSELLKVTVLPFNGGRGFGTGFHQDAIRIELTEAAERASATI